MKVVLAILLSLLMMEVVADLHHTDYLIDHQFDGRRLEESWN